MRCERMEIAWSCKWLNLFCHLFFCGVAGKTRQIGLDISAKMRHKLFYESKMV